MAENKCVTGGLLLPEMSGVITHPTYNNRRDPLCNIFLEESGENPWIPMISVLETRLQCDICMAYS